MIVCPLTRRRFISTAGSVSLAAPLKALVPTSLPSGIRPPTGLFVGACYQPVDRSSAEVRRDISIMKQAGFSLTRMGDLSWDAFEPEEGQFTFDWFDDIMNQMHLAGIRVMVDIPGLPAPLWLHQRYPGVDIVDQHGDRLHSVDRYMDDISDPDYRRLAARLGRQMISRYQDHPATIAFGYDNEIGNSYLSYSDGTQTRFRDWLHQRYGTLEGLNHAWATQRWSRRYSDWAQVFLPYQDGPGPPERFLDLHRFWSDQVIGTLSDLEAIRRELAPGIPAISNLYDTSERKGFDYLRSYRQYASNGAMGFYPSSTLSGSFDALMMRAGTGKPVWFNEFEAGGPTYHGKPGQSRMLAYLSLLHGGQAVLAWTFNSHLGGEEQALFGLLDHDGTPSWKLAEFKSIADEFRALQQFGFPRTFNPDVAIGYSFASRVASHPNGPANTTNDFFKMPYREHVLAAYEPFFNSNTDVAVIDVATEQLSAYKLIVMAGCYVMDAETADALRKFVRNGGTVVMTAWSAKVDEHAQWFSTPLPGRLADVFGIETNAFYSAEQPVVITLNGFDLQATRREYEQLILKGASVLATYQDRLNNGAAITSNRYGQGRAVYVAVPAQAAILERLYERLCQEAGIITGPPTPKGVCARKVGTRTLYVNTNPEAANLVLGDHLGPSPSDIPNAKQLDIPGYGAAFV